MSQSELQRLIDVVSVTMQLPCGTILGKTEMEQQGHTLHLLP